MMLLLALVDGVTVVLALTSATFAWHHPVAEDWSHGVVPPVLLLGLGTLGALYYADAYDWRIASNLSRFAARLPRCLALGSVPLILVYTLFPDARTAVIASLLVVPGVLLALHAVFYRFARSRAFAERVLVIGTGPLACRAVQAVEQESDRRAIVIAVAGAPAE